MFSNRLEWLGAAGSDVSVRAGLRGVEKETLRVDASGRLAQTPHPRGCGSPLTHPSITTDYSEALLELVTPPVTTSWQTLQQVFDIHAFVNRQIGDERLWPMSMPCELGGDETIPIADYGVSNEGMFRTIYRRGLGHRYGRAMQAIAGVHFNYSPPEAFWPAYQDWLKDRSDPAAFKSAALMGLVRNYYRNAWLVIYLFGASPALSRSFLPAGNALLQPLDSQTWYAPFATSLRMSDIGYQNKTQARLRISANSLDEYVHGLVQAVTTAEERYQRIGVKVDGEYRQLNANRLQIENEYYSTIRPKPPTDSYRTTVGLRERGVQYVEIRTLDLSPRDPVGMNQSQMRFLEVLLLYCLLSDSQPIDEAEQAEILQRDLTVARDGRRPGLTLQFGGYAATIAERAAQMAGSLLEVAALLDDTGDACQRSVREALAACAEPERTPSSELLGQLRDTGNSFVEYGRAVADAHRAYFLSMAMEPERLEAQKRVAAESLRAAAALEAASTEPFDVYLERFMQRV
ncbi:MAG: glutamate--cysteine ligase [Gammaproteobacteria bacterium]